MLLQRCRSKVLLLTYVRVMLITEPCLTNRTVRNHCLLEAADGEPGDASAACCRAIWHSLHGRVHEGSLAPLPAMSLKK